MNNVDDTTKDGEEIASTAHFRCSGPCFAMTKFVRVIVEPSADQLRPKVGKTMVGCAAVGHSNNFQKGRTSAERSVGKFVAAPVLTACAVKACALEAFLPT